MTSESSSISVIKQKRVLRVVQMEGFYRKKGEARKPISKVYLGQTPFLFFIFWGGEGLQGFYHAYIYIYLLSLGQGQEWRRNKMQKVITTLPTPKFQAS